MKPVTILGLGPAALLAAHACDEAGLPFRFVASRIEQSQISGAQFLHVPISEMTNALPDSHVRFTKLGTREGYAEKVYGDPNAPTSWDKYDGDYPAWSLQEVYGLLWLRYREEIERTEVRNVDWTYLRAYAKLGPVISTIPRQSVCCDGEHRFDWQAIGVVPTMLDSDGGRDNEVVYNGHEEIPWYRSSRLFGVEQTELAWGSIEDETFKLMTLVPAVREGYEVISYEPRKVIKPTTTNCTCWMKFDVLFAGRYGAWDKEQLTHHAYEATRDYLRTL